MDHRRQELGLTWDQVAARGSITGETLRQIRRGESTGRPLTRRAVERGLEWPTNTVDRVLNGARLEDDDLGGGLAGLIGRVREVLDSRFSAATQVQMIRELVDEAEQEASAAGAVVEDPGNEAVTGA